MKMLKNRHFRAATPPGDGAGVAVAPREEINQLIRKPVARDACKDHGPQRDTATLRAGLGSVVLDRYGPSASLEALPRIAEALAAYRPAALAWLIDKQAFYARLAAARGATAPNAYLLPCKRQAPPLWIFSPKRKRGIDGHKLHV
jgi:hypothetical protein